MIMTIHHQAHTRHIAVHRIIQATAKEAAVIHQRAILRENTTAVATHQEVVQILRIAVRAAIVIPVAALHIQEALQVAAPVRRNIIMIHTMMRTGKFFLGGGIAMPYDGYGGDEGFPHDGKKGRCGYYL